MILATGKETKVFNLPRATGKSMRMLYASEFNNVPILCANRSSKESLVDLARRYRIKITEPITVDDFVQNKHKYHNVLVDEALSVLKMFLGRTNIIGLTLSDDDMNERMGNWDYNGLVDIVNIDKFIEEIGN